MKKNIFVFTDTMTQSHRISKSHSKSFSALFLFILLSFAIQAQNVENVRFFVYNNQVIIDYDLRAGTDIESYLAELWFSPNCNNQFTEITTGLTKDIGFTKPGKNKRIIWTPNKTINYTNACFKVKVICTPKAKAKSHSLTKSETMTDFGIEMIFVKGGTFKMGSPENEKGRYSDEYQHQVTVSDFYIGKYEVTQKQWKEIMGNNPSSFKGDNLPVEQVSWNDVQEFIKKLNAKTGQTYRLPTEAEWEYACRAGSTTPFNTGNCLSTEQANYDGNRPYTNCSKGKYRRKTTAVGSFSPNAWGIYDMHGNVWEWCNDWYDSDYYKNSPKNNPQGPSSGSLRVLRGGSWDAGAKYCRSAHRDDSTPDCRYSDIGFRLAKTN